MANIENELNNISNARYGEEVRTSIHDGINKINQSVETAIREMRDYNGELDNALGEFEANARGVMTTIQMIFDEKVENMDNKIAAFDDWFARLDAMLEPDVAANLANQITKLQDKSQLFDTGARRRIYRGKNLGTSVSAEHQAAIKAGTFEDLYLGDYWVPSTSDPKTEKGYVIVDFDYWYDRSYAPYMDHHVVLMSKNVLGRAPMATGSYTGYGTSTLRTVTMESYRQNIISMFGADHIMKYRDAYVSKWGGNMPTETTSTDANIEIPTEGMIFGNRPLSPSTANGTVSLSGYSVGQTQLALLRLYPNFITAEEYDSGVSQRTSYWLQDPVTVTPTRCSSVNDFGMPQFDTATVAKGIRPVFGLV